MLPADFDQITIEHVLQLVAKKIPENRLLDYKQELPAIGSLSDGKEFVADLSSFANAGGGDIVFGIVEEKDAAGRNTGLPGSAPGVQLAGENNDQATLRLHQIAQTKLDPAIPGLRIRPFVSPTNECFFVVRIPQSWLAPHMVLGGSSNFALRNDNAKIWMDREQIRQAFLFSDSIRDRIEQFRDSRLARILSGTIGVPLQPAWKRVTHVIPIAGLYSSLSINLSVVNPLAGQLPKFAGILQRRPNVDGVMCASDLSGRRPSPEFIQVFRNGTIEHVSTGALEQGGIRQNVPGLGIEAALTNEFSNYMEFYQSQSVPTPIIVMLSLLDVQGRHLLMADSLALFPEFQFDRPQVMLPEVMLTSYDKAHQKSRLSELLDSFWQAGGHRGSPNRNRAS